MFCTYDHLTFAEGIRDRVTRHVDGNDEGPTEMTISRPCIDGRS